MCAIKKLASRDAAFLRRKLDLFVYPQIKTEPFWGNNIKKLQGYTPDTWRYRIGKFRVFYIIDHLEPDWILIYTTDDTTLQLERTGTHSDLFKK